MGVMEIVLIVLGIIVFVGSFLIPAGKGNDDSQGEKIDEDAIRELVEKEVEGAKTQISDIVDETITYAMEKTERSMDRLTNEKMLAVNEYSDTVLEEINKNHKEVVFLYDMLNDKHENLKSTVTEAAKKVSEVKQTVKDAKIAVKEVEAAARETEADAGEEENPAAEAEDFHKEAEFAPITAKRVEVRYSSAEAHDTVKSEEKQKEELQEESGKKPVRRPRVVNAAKPAGKDEKTVQTKETENGTAKTAADQAEVEVNLNASGRTGGRNSNERILELHKKGKSNMAIAKELGLGIGEVKLVIDLFEGQ